MSASDASKQQPTVRSPLLTITQSLPSLVVLGAASLVPLWGVYKLDWSVMAIVLAYVAQTAAAAFLAYRRAKRATGRRRGPRMTCWSASSSRCT